MGKRIQKTKKEGNQEQSYPRPTWVPKGVSSEEELCPECFKAVGVRNRYKLICMLGKASEGMSVSELTKSLKLKQPTVTHHLQILGSIDAVESEREGRKKIYQLNRNAHCFEECKIPYS